MTRRFQYCLVATLVQLPLAFPQASQVPFSITIDAETNVYKAGSEVKISLIFKNISDHEIPYVRSPGIGVEPRGENFTNVEVRDLKGALMTETDYHRALRGKPQTGADPAGRKKSGEAPGAAEAPKPQLVNWGSYVGYMLKPGESREEVIVVSKLYDLDQPGQYTITAWRRLSDHTASPNHKIIAKSNTLTITIIK